MWLLPCGSHADPHHSIVRSQEARRWPLIAFIALCPSLSTYEWRYTNVEMKRWSLHHFVSVTDACFTCYLSCREFWALGELCRALWEFTRHPVSDDTDLHERSSIIRHLVQCEIRFAVLLRADAVCRNLPWYATFPTPKRIMRIVNGTPGKWRSHIPDPWWLHVASLTMDTTPGAFGAGCKVDLANLLQSTVSICPSSLVPAGYLDNLCALGPVWVNFSGGRDDLCDQLSFLSPDFLHLHAYHQCGTRIEEIIGTCTRVSANIPDQMEVRDMWNWLSKIRSDPDSIHHQLLSCFFSGITADGGHIDPSEFPNGHAYGTLSFERCLRLLRKPLIRRKTLKTLIHVYNSSNWPPERLWPHGTLSCIASIERERNSEWLQIEMRNKQGPSDPGVEG